MQLFPNRIRLLTGYMVYASQITPTNNQVSLIFIRPFHHHCYKLYLGLYFCRFMSFSPAWTYLQWFEMINRTHIWNECKKHIMISTILSYWANIWNEKLNVHSTRGILFTHFGQCQKSFMLQLYAYDLAYLPCFCCPGPLLWIHGLLYLFWPVTLPFWLLRRSPQRGESTNFTSLSR